MSKDVEGSLFVVVPNSYFANAHLQISVGTIALFDELINSLLELFDCGVTHCVFSRSDYIFHQFHQMIVKRSKRMRSSRSRFPV